MSTGDASADYSPEQLAELWPVTSAGSIACPDGSGMSAAVWTSRRPAEIWGTETHTNVITMALRPYTCEVWADGKLLPFNRCEPGSLQVMAAHVVPRACFDGPIELLHVYYPHDRLADLACVQPGALELRDPRAGHDRDIAATCRQLVQEMHHPAGLTRLHFDALTISLGVQLIRRWSNHARKPDAMRGGLTPRALRRVADHMRDHLADDLHLEDLAALTGLSARHFARAFRQSTGLPPHRWMINQRIERARDLLARGNLPIADIALLCGFADQSHFTTAFRSATGVTPAVFRRSARW